MQQFVSIKFVYEYAARISAEPENKQATEVNEVAD